MYISTSRVQVSQSKMVAGFYDSLAKPGADNRNEVLYALTDI